MKKETLIVLVSLVPILLFSNIIIFKNNLIANIMISLALVIISGKIVSEVIKLKDSTN